MEDITYACPRNGEPGICRKTELIGGKERRANCGAKHTHRVESNEPGRCVDHETKLVPVTS